MGLRNVFEAFGEEKIRETDKKESRPTLKHSLEMRKRKDLKNNWGLRNLPAAKRVEVLLQRVLKEQMQTNKGKLAGSSC